MSNQGDITDSLYDGSAELGRFTTTIYLIVAVILGVVLCSIGGYLLTTDQKNLIDSTATITKATCNDYYDSNKKTRYTCTLNIAYTVEGKDYSGTITVDNNVPYNEGASIGITYDVNNPKNVTENIVRNSTLAIILSMCAGVIVLVAWLYYYITQRFKVAAAAQGAGTALSFLTAPFRK